MTLTRLVHGALAGSNGFNVLLLGRKGVGKTGLLTNLQLVALDLFDQIMCITLTFPKSAPPIQEINKAAGLGLDDVATVADLEAALAACGRYLFLVLDAFQTVFTADCQDGKQVIHEAIEIGQSKRGRIFCVITGSSSELRELCFAERESASDWLPHYTRRDMNNVKYQTRWIFPFLSLVDFISATALIVCKKSLSFDMSDDKRVSALYDASVGNPSVMEQALVSGEFNLNYCNLNRLIPGTIEEALVSHIRNMILVSSEGAKVTTGLEARALVMKTYPLDLSEAYSALGGRFPNVDLVKELYKLADRGFVRFSEAMDQGSNYFVWLVGLGSLALAADTSNSVSLMDLVALNNVATNPTDAESVVLRLLAMSSNAWLDVKLKGYKGELDLEKLEDCPREDIVLSLWKETFEGHDCYGSDGIIILPSDADSTSGDPRYKLVRIQVKLARFSSSNMKDPSRNLYDDIFDRWNTHAQSVLDLFHQAKYPIDSVEYIIVTTNNCAPNDIAEFERRTMNHGDFTASSKIRVLNRKYLAEMVWPPPVKSLGKMYT